jgi:hypothetical protein
VEGWLHASLLLVDFGFPLEGEQGIVTASNAQPSSGPTWLGHVRHLNPHGYFRVFGHKIFSRGPSIRLVSIAALAQALIGLGTGRSPSSSGCSPSAQTLPSRSQSRSSTLSSEPIMHLLTRPSWRGPLVKFRRRCSGCPVPGT